MTVLAALNPTLLDVAKRLDPNGKIAQIAELLSQNNPILDDMVVIEGNLPTGHRTTARTGIPTPTWRKLYQGVQPGKSTTVQVTDSCGMLEAYAEIDKALADLNGNTAAFRLSEDRAFIEGMSQEMTQTMFYGNEGTEPEAFTGLAPRFNSLSAQNKDNIIKGADVSGNDNASIWLVCWGANTVHGIYPKGSQAGLQMTDKGHVTIENVDGNGGRMEAYRTHYRWDLGLSVRDWRYIVRVQYKQSALTKNAGSGADLIDLLTDATERVQDLNLGRPVFYGNRTARSFLRRQIANKVAQSTLTMDTVAGKRVLAFDGIPVQRSDALTATESAIV